MYKLKEFYNKIPPFFKNKYFVTSIIFLIWINFLNDDPPYELIQNLKEKKNIENKIQLTEKKNNNLKAKLNELDTNIEALEKYARENFQMTKEGETLIIIKEKPQDKKHNKNSNNSVIKIFIISAVLLILIIVLMFLIKKYKRK